MEKKQRSNFKSEIGDERKEQQRIIEKQKADEAEARKKVEFKKEGRTKMLRSTKPAIKKKEIKQTVDQETLDNLKYLGDLEDLVAQ